MTRRAVRCRAVIALALACLAPGVSIVSDALAANPPTPAPPQQIERGRVLLERYHCGSCHTIPGVAAARATVASSLAQFGRRSYIAGRVANEPDMLARWIVEPASVVPGTLMPAMGVSPDEARDIAAYLGQLQ